jgi:dTDP-glucose pyrophosphorylase|tara:strand:+ start:741 stop:1442 length:702 start_codon:yes stop_codon:yes gene_type:complete
MNILLPIAGLGSRFSKVGFELPKPLIKVEGKPMIQRAIESLGVQGNYIFIIRDNETLKLHLQSIYPDSNIISINYLTDGPASTCLLAKEQINNNQPLLIANCDQIMWWNSLAFTSFLNSCPYDGLVVTYNEDTPKNSYVKLDKNGLAVRIAEKEVISNVSLNGIHYWKNGSDFINSAELMIKDNERYNNEFYVGPTYNTLIKQGKKIGVYHIPNEQHHAVGTPEDLLKYTLKL